MGAVIDLPRSLVQSIPKAYRLARIEDVARQEQLRYASLGPSQRKKVRRDAAAAGWAEYAHLQAQADKVRAHTDRENALREQIEREVATIRGMDLHAYRLWRDTAKTDGARKARRAEREMRARIKSDQAQKAQKDRLKAELVAQARIYRTMREQICKKPDRAEYARRTRCDRAYKIAYENTEVGQMAASLHVDDLRAGGFGLDLVVYPCRCGWLHVGNDAQDFARRVKSSLRKF